MSCTLLQDWQYNGVGDKTYLLGVVFHLARDILGQVKLVLDCVLVEVCCHHLCIFLHLILLHIQTTSH